jgi:hypothetical protein
MLLAVAPLLLFALAAAAAERPKVDLGCLPTGERLVYDCTIRLQDARTRQPINHVEIVIAADMPSMPMAHNVRPVQAAAGQEAGTYRARLTLEMHGDWALRIDVTRPVRDRIIKLMRFEPGRVGPSPGSR